MFKLTRSCIPLATKRRFASNIPKRDSKDIFGTLDERGRQALSVEEIERYYPDDEDNYDKEEFDLKPRKNAYYYKYEIPKIAKQGNVGLRKALELYRTMKKDDRLTPTIYHLTPLITACAKAGYTKKAFDLYKEMQRYVGKPSTAAVTSLINACAESPFQEYGLEKLNWFREHLLLEYQYKFNVIQYQSAIKAYCRLERLDEAVKLVKEMVDHNIIPDTETFNMLLIGCASNKESGTTLALRLYKRLRLYNLKPNLVTFRLMLRCIRDCGIGPERLIRQTIGDLPMMTNVGQLLKYKQMSPRRRMKDRFDNFVWVPQIEDLVESVTKALEIVDEDRTTKLFEIGGDTKSSELIKIPTDPDYDLLPRSLDTKLPNLLSDDHLMLSQRIEAIQFDKIKTPYDRLMLFGGIHGFLDIMEKEQCHPDSKTFSLLLSCIVPSKANHLEYYRLALDYKIERDLLFYDLLVRSICRNYKNPTRLAEALDYLDKMQKDLIRPNISTFESLALGCDSWKDAKRLIDDIERSGFTISEILIARLFDVALKNNDFFYLIRMIKFAKERSFEPNIKLVDKLEEKRIASHDVILMYEKGLLKEIPHWLNDRQIKGYDDFCEELGNWLKKINLKEEEHPWSQYYLPEKTDKRWGFRKFVQKFKALDKLKEEALERGENLDNLVKKLDEKYELSNQNGAFNSLK